VRLPVLLRLIACLLYAVVIPVFVVSNMQVPDQSQWIMYGLCAYTAFFSGYEAWRHYYRGKKTLWLDGDL
jgi:hypothetical protein